MIKCKVIQSGNQIDSQHKSATAIPIPLCQDPKDFQMPDDMFDHYSLRCQLLVELLLFLCQLSAFQLFERCPRVFVPIEQALITTVGKAFHFFWQVRFALLVKRASRVALAWQIACQWFVSSLCMPAVGFLSCAAFSCPNNIAFVFFWSFNRRLGDIHHDHFNFRR